MAEPESVAAVWKTIAYALGAVVASLAGTIVAMAKWFAKKREEVAKDYQNLMTDLNKNLDRVGDYLRDVYKRETKQDVDRTQFDFKINDRDNK